MSATKVTSPKGYVSYPQIHEPRIEDNGKEKYCMDFVMKDEKAAKVFVAKVNKAIKKAKDDKKDWKDPKRSVRVWEMQLKDGNEKFLKDEDKYALYENAWYVQVKNMKQPMVCKIEDGMARQVEDIKNELYPGCEAVVKVEPMPYDNKYCGCTHKLFAIAITGEGERIGGGIDPYEKGDPNAEFAEFVTAQEDNIEDLLSEEEVPF